MYSKKEDIKVRAVISTDFQNSSTFKLLLLLLLLLHPFNGLFSRTTWVSRHQKGKPFWISLEQEMMAVAVASAFTFKLSNRFTVKC